MKCEGCEAVSVFYDADPHCCFDPREPAKLLGIEHTDVESPDWCPIRSARGELTHCEGCWEPCESTDARWTRQHTFYPSMIDNWVYMCDKCRQENDDRWQEQWDEYNAGRL